MDCDRTSATSSFSPFRPTRRQLIAAASAVPLVGVAPAAVARPRTEAPSLSFTRATNGSATLAPAGDRLIAEVQGTLWSLPRSVQSGMK